MSSPPIPSDQCRDITGPPCSKGSATVTEASSLSLLSSSSPTSHSHHIWTENNAGCLDSSCHKHATCQQHNSRNAAAPKQHPHYVQSSSSVVAAGSSASRGLISSGADSRKNSAKLFPVHAPSPDVGSSSTHHQSNSPISPKDTVLAADVAASVVGNISRVMRRSNSCIYNYTNYIHGLLNMPPVVNQHRHRYCHADNHRCGDPPLDTKTTSTPRSRQCGKLLPRHYNCNCQHAHDHIRTAACLQYDEHYKRVDLHVPDDKRSPCNIEANTKSAPKLDNFNDGQIEHPYNNSQANAENIPACPHCEVRDGHVNPNECNVCVCGTCLHVERCSHHCHDRDAATHDDSSLLAQQLQRQRWRYLCYRDFFRGANVLQNPPASVCCTRVAPSLCSAGSCPCYHSSTASKLIEQQVSAVAHGQSHPALHTDRGEISSSSSSSTTTAPHKADTLFTKYPSALRNILMSHIRQSEQQETSSVLLESERTHEQSSLSSPSLYQTQKQPQHHCTPAEVIFPPSSNLSNSVKIFYGCLFTEVDRYVRALERRVFPLPVQRMSSSTYPPSTLNSVNPCQHHNDGSVDAGHAAHTADHAEHGTCVLRTQNTSNTTGSNIITDNDNSSSDTSNENDTDNRSCERTGQKNCRHQHHPQEALHETLREQQRHCQMLKAYIHDLEGTLHMLAAAVATGPSAAGSRKTLKRRGTNLSTQENNKEAHSHDDEDVAIVSTAVKASLPDRLGLPPSRLYELERKEDEDEFEANNNAQQQQRQACDTTTTYNNNNKTNTDDSVGQPPLNIFSSCPGRLPEAVAHDISMIEQFIVESMHKT